MEKVTVRIATPVKTTAQIFMPGTHDVEPKVAEEMAAAGVLVPEGEATAEAEAPGETAAEEIARLTGERDAAIARARDAEARLAAIADEKKAAAASAAARPKTGKAAPKG